MSETVMEMDIIRQERQEVANRKTLGFWIYLMTDVVLFSSLFATFAVLRNAVASGPSGQDLFSMPFVLGETLVLLTSTFTIGMAVVLAKRGFKIAALFNLLLTFGLGVAFLVMELTEFTEFVHEGASWQTSAFLSSFFALVATHGLHVAFGLLWMLGLGIKMIRRWGKETDLGRLALLGTFWHFLDIIWIFIFTFVYMIGVLG